MNTDCVIPYELTFYYPGSLNSYMAGNDTYSTIATVVDAKKNNRERYNAKISIVGRYGAEKIDDPSYIQEVTIKNEEFTLSVSEETVKAYYYDNEMNIQVSSPSIEEHLGQGKSFRLKINIGEFWNLLKPSGFTLMRGQIPGKFCFQLSKSAPSLVHPVLENPHDEKLKEARDAGKALKGRLTSKWVPGHMYAMKNGKIAVYLGEVKDIKKIGFSSSRGVTVNHDLTYRGFLERCFEGSHYSIGSSIPEGRLIILMDGNVSKNVKDILNNEKGNDIVDTTVKFLTNSNMSRSYVLSLIVRPNTSSPLSGADLGEFLTTQSPGTFYQDLCKRCEEILLGKEKKVVKKLGMEGNLFMFAKNVLSTDKEYRKSFIETDIETSVYNITRYLNSWFNRSTTKGNLTPEKLKAEFTRYCGPFLNETIDILGYTEEERQFAMEEVIKGVNKG